MTILNCGSRASLAMCSATSAAVLKRELAVIRAKRGCGIKWR